jgi:hypothetical protein
MDTASLSSDVTDGRQPPRLTFTPMLVLSCDGGSELHDQAMTVATMTER